MYYQYEQFFCHVKLRKKIDVNITHKHFRWKKKNKHYIGQL